MKLPVTLLAVAALFSGAACAPPPPRANVIADRVLVQDGVGKPVRSLDATTGKAVASFGFEGWADGLDSAGRLVFVHGFDGLAARDIDSGDVKWRVFMKLGYGWKAVVGGSNVFAPVWREKDSAWVGFDTATGSRRFELRCDRWAPLAANSDVVVTIQEHLLVAADAADGKERWRSEIEVRPPLLIEGGRLFVRVDDDKLGVFTASSGALQRRIDPGGTTPFRGFRSSHPRLAASGNLLAWIDDDVLTVADAATGKVSWTNQGADLLAIANGAVVTNHGSEVVGLDPATGSTKWKLSLTDDPEALSARGDTVTVRSGDVRVLDAGTGKTRFKVVATDGER